MKNIIVFLFIIQTINSNAQLKSFLIGDSINGSWGRMSCFSADGNFITAAIYFQDAEIVKNTIDGVPVWNTRIYFPGRDFLLNCIFPTADSGCIVAGNTDTTNTRSNIFVAKLDVSENVLWSKEYDHIQHQEDAFDVLEMPPLGGIFENRPVCWGFRPRNPISNS